jgi:hypothetical protein
MRGCFSVLAVPVEMLKFAQAAKAAAAALKVID